MSILRSCSAAVVAAACAGCFGGRVPSDYPHVAEQAAVPVVPPPSTPAPTLAQDEATIAKEARLDAITRVAVARNPSVLEARARAQAALARVKPATRLPDLEFKYELWGQPLNKPWALGDATMHMFGLRQTFPAAGTLDAQARVAFEDAKVALDIALARELDVIADVRKTWAAYYAADRDKATHVEHATLTKQLVDLARVQLQVAKTAQSDVLKLDLELTRVHTDIATLDAQISIQRARLNVAMGRAVDAAVGPPPDLKPADIVPRIEQVRALVLARRPELAAATGAVRKSEAAVDAAKSSAKYPTVMAGVDYQLMPTAPMPHNFGVMIQFSLPWFSAKRSEDVKAAEADVVADKAARDALETQILLQVAEALARWEGARKTFDLVDGQLLPQATKTFDATRASYAAGGGDSLSVVDGLRTLLQVRVERNRALAQLEIAITDVERAIGGPLPGAKEAKP